MTGYTVHTGTNEKYAAGWDQIFSSGSSTKKAKKAKVKTKAEAKPSKKKSGKAKRGK